MKRLEAPVSVCDLAKQFAIEGEREAARIRFAKKADKKRRTTGRFPGGDLTEYWQLAGSAA